MPDAVYKQAMDQVVTILQGLDLEGIADNEIKVRKFPWDDTTPPHKGITVSWEEEMEGSGTNCRDDIGYPMTVTLCQGTGKGWSDDMDRITTWRQAIRQRFLNARLDGVSVTGVSPLPCKVKHGKPELPEKYKKNYDVSQLVIIAWFRESRAS